MKKAFAIMIALCVILILTAVTITGCAESPEPEHARPQQEEPSTATEETSINVKVVIDPQAANPPEKTELVMSGMESWKPDLSDGEDIRTISLTPGEYDLFIFPDGVEGASAYVTVIIDETTKDVDTVTVLIGDNDLLVTGPITGKVAGFSR